MATLPKAKIIVIAGPTASGKTDLSVMLAKKYGGEIVSADSRQVYRGMNIGTGKATLREQGGIPHHLLDVASPKRTFTAAHYRKQGRRAIANILKDRKVPIVVGGTGFYIDALLGDAPLPDIRPNPALRKKWERRSAPELFALLQKKDPRRAAEIDRHNKRRLVRALEIIAATGAPIAPRGPLRSQYEILFIGLRPDPATLRKKIHDRLMSRLKRGMVAEVRRLHEKEGVGWKRLDDLGLEYRFVSRYLRGLMDRNEMVVELERAINHYAKRQMTWFKKNPGMHWITGPESAEPLVKKFLAEPQQKTAPRG